MVNFYYIYGWYYIYGFYYIYGWYTCIELILMFMFIKWLCDCFINNVFKPYMYPWSATFE